MQTLVQYNSKYFQNTDFYKVKSLCCTDMVVYWWCKSCDGYLIFSLPWQLKGFFKADKDHEIKLCALCNVHSEIIMPYIYNDASFSSNGR